MKKIYYSSVGREGFTMVEALLILIVLLLTVFVGTYVYSTQHDKKQNTGTTTKSATSSKEKAAAKQSQRYLQLAGIGIEIPVSSELANAEYIPAADSNFGSLITDEYQRAQAACLADDTASGGPATIVGVTRHEGVYKVGVTEDPPYETFAKQFDTFYVSTSRPDGGVGAECDPAKPAEQAKMQELFRQAHPRFIEAVKNAQKITLL